MSHSNTTLNSSHLTTESVLRREVPWETYLTARLISDKDLQLIKRYDKATREVQSQLIKEAGLAYVDAFVSVLRNVTKEETVQYVLALLDDLLTEDSSRGDLLSEQSQGQGKKPDICNILQRLLQRTDWFTQEKACRLLTTVLQLRPEKIDGDYLNGFEKDNASSSSTKKPPIANGRSDPVDGVLLSFVDWLCGQLRRPTHPSSSVLVAVTALSRLLRKRPVRSLLLRSGGVQLLGPLLQSPGTSGRNVQLMYEAALCIWQLSFYQPAVEVICSSGITPNLVELAKTAQKEKVIRVALNALSNLLLAPGVDAGPDMVEAGLPKVVAQRKNQTWEDEDVSATLKVLEEKLAENIQLLSSFEKYKREVLGGSLDWTPMHSSDQFWRENVSKFEEKDFQILRVLLKLLESSREPKTLAVGCNDVRYFITFHPIGRQIVQDLRGKELAMRLMMHPDVNVQKQALMCVQNIMLAKDKLEFLYGQSQS